MTDTSLKPDSTLVKTPIVTDPVKVDRFATDESYFNLVRRRFRRSISGMVGLIGVVALLIMALFADFFAPVNPNKPALAFAPPTAIRFFDEDGNFHFSPVLLRGRGDGRVRSDHLPAQDRIRHR